MDIIGRDVLMTYVAEPAEINYTFDPTEAVYTAGNQVAFGPLTLIDYTQNTTDYNRLYDYHITDVSAAIDTGIGGAGRLLEDFDNDPRPAAAEADSDIGADEFVQ